jgi:pilus assembly protein Flp/PilA
LILKENTDCRVFLQHFPQITQKWQTACYYGEVSSLRLEKLIDPGSTQMKDKFLMLSVKLQTMLASEEGQDLIEYALVVALIALGATAGMKSLAGAINNAFMNIGTTLGQCVSGTCPS